MIKQGVCVALTETNFVSQTFIRPIAFAFTMTCLSAWAQSPQPPQSIGEVEQLRGAGFAQSEGQLPRILGRGLALNEGDRLTTAENALAVIRLKDGTKMTLRPGTELVLSQYSYSDSNNASGGANAMVLQLLRGGLRALTGLISKASPNAARIQTSTATIGIRGTDFDARICKGGECAAATAPPVTPTTSAISASARVIKQQGQLTALDEQGQRRPLSPGASIYPGDIIETASNASALLAFRDESKVNLGASTRFRVDDFAYDAADVTSSRYFMSLLRGSLRAVTGLIGKANRQNVRFTSSTATIGIRGTDFAMDCTGACASDVRTSGLGGSGNEGDAGADGDPTTGFTVFTFDGVVAVGFSQPGPGGQPQAPIELAAGRGLVFTGQLGPTGQPVTEPLTVPPGQLPTESPAVVPIPQGTFAQGAVGEAQDGLFVFVRDGHIVLTSGAQQVDLGRNEGAFSGAAANVVRMQSIPLHILRDSVPLPTGANINISGLRPPQNTSLVCQ